LNTVYKLPYVPDLIAAKLAGDEKGRLPDADVGFHQQEYERLTALLEDAQATSQLPEQPSGADALNDLLLRLRLET